jgi:hypothetical protein
MSSSARKRNSRKKLGARPARKCGCHNHRQPIKIIRELIADPPR